MMRPYGECIDASCRTENMDFQRHPERYFLQWLFSPLIYGLIVPVVFLDLAMEIYHHVCFPIYGLAKVERWRYISTDRNKLAYLNWFNKLNCLYCGYVNGLLRYACEIAARSEWYWCGIMHHKTKGFIIPPHQRHFLKYGDEKAWRAYVGLPEPPKRRKR